MVEDERTTLMEHSTIQFTQIRHFQIVLFNLNYINVAMTFIERI
jgi:hypothetical protein